MFLIVLQILKLLCVVLASRSVEVFVVWLLLGFFGGEGGGGQINR